MAKTILVTGAAGFIGSHTVEALLRRGDRVIGLDNLNDYYDPARKDANLKEIQEALANPEQWKQFTFVKGDIRDRVLVKGLFEEHRFDAIVHLAAMAGVRISIDDPELYYDVNVNGTLALLDAAVGRGGIKRKTNGRCPCLCLHRRRRSMAIRAKFPLYPKIRAIGLWHPMPRANGAANY